MNVNFFLGGIEMLTLPYKEANYKLSSENLFPFYHAHKLKQWVSLVKLIEWH